MFSLKKCFLTLIIVLPLSMTTFAAMTVDEAEGLTGDEAEALTRQMYSNFKVGQKITVSERGEIFKNGQFHCAYENIHTTNVLGITRDNYEIETIISDNLHEDCKLREVHREIEILNISQEAQETLKFARFLRETHSVELSLDLEKMALIFEMTNPTRKLEISYEEMTPLHLEAELSQGSSGHRGGQAGLSYKSGRPDVKVQ